MIYPNPANHDITIEYCLLQDSETNICLFTLDGRKLICNSFKESSGSKSHSINLTPIGNGVFILRLETLDSGQTRQIKTFKIIKD